jgi:stage V sporulation protein D (sporulation-specific penicillin-binding protein)
MPRLKIAPPALGRFKTRIRFIAVAFVFVALLCVGRLYNLQVMHGNYYALRAQSEFTIPGSLFDRGTIYFTTKNGAYLPAATTQEGVSLGLDPQKIAATSTGAMYEKLSSVVPLSQGDFFAKAGQSGQVYVPLANHLSTTTGAEIQKLGFPGAVVQADRWRYYPGGSLAAQTIGFVAYSDDNSLAGRYGLEREYDPLLLRNDSEVYTNFFVQLFAGAQSTLAGQGEGDVVTSIEPSVQAELERELAAYRDQWHPEMAGGIIMDPQTGAIVAMGSWPSFDINSFSQSDPNLFKNPLVSNVYEMGSIIKPLTMAAGLDSGAITASTTYNDTGCIYLSNYPICNYDLRARGPNTPMQQILSQSLNVGASFIATEIGPARMRDYFTAHYGFGTTTGIDLPAEAGGIVNNLKSPRQLEYDEAAFGQGIAMTPIQTIRALATLANGGYLVTPHVGQAVINSAGLELPLSYPPKQPVLKPETALAVDRMLTTVVDTVLAHGAIKMDHYSIAAKTGTAQIANPAGGYYDGEYLHSYFGFFPSYHARFIIFLYAFKPQGVQYASESWSDRFKDLVQFLINYYQVPPDR